VNVPTAPATPAQHRLAEPIPLFALSIDRQGRRRVTTCPPAGGVNHLPHAAEGLTVTAGRKTLEGFCRKPRPLSFDGQPHIVHPQRFRRPLVMIAFASSDYEFSPPARHFGRPPRRQIADDLRDCIRSARHGHIRQPRKAAVYRICRLRLEDCSSGASVWHSRSVSSWSARHWLRGKLHPAREVTDNRGTIEQPI